MRDILDGRNRRKKYNYLEECEKEIERIRGKEGTNR
jgi:hypothetical protein